jgi:hypothetical protein
LLLVSCSGVCFLGILRSCLAGTPWWTPIA